jgi:methylenetetrahydrofolate dehydrogenase (NADP+)/methenyltetrahydrofolate cyclohydrolase
VLLRDQLGSMSGLNAVIGAQLTRRQADGATAAAGKLHRTMAHSRTRDLPDVVRRADIVIAAVGRPQMIRATGSSPRHGDRRRHQPRAGAERAGKTRLVGDVD